MRVEMETIVQKTFDVVSLLFTRMLPVLFVVTFIQEMGWLKGLDRFAGWIVRWTGFASVTGQAFVANFGSVYAGSGMLVNLYRDGRISRSYLVLSVVFASFPAHLRAVASSTGPVVFSLFTLPVAFFYIGFSFTEALSKMIVAGTASRFVAAGSMSFAEGKAKEEKHDGETVISVRLALAATVKRTMGHAWRIFVFVSVVTVVVLLLDRMGFFQMLPVNVSCIGLPETFNTAVFSYMGNVYAGMAMISSFLFSGEADTVMAIQLLVFCMICSRPVMMVKEAPSYYFALYGPVNGSILILFHLGVFFPLAGLTLWGIRAVVL